MSTRKRMTGPLPGLVRSRGAGVGLDGPAAERRSGASRRPWPAARSRRPGRSPSRGAPRRPGHESLYICAMKAGIIGLSSVGKSTLFQLLTGLPAAPPGGRAEPRLGVARVPDSRAWTAGRPLSARRSRPSPPSSTWTCRGWRKGEGAALVDLPALRGVDALLARGPRLRVGPRPPPRRLGRPAARREDARPRADPGRPGRGGEAPRAARGQHQEGEQGRGRGRARALPPR